jgi:hypothetical protein
MKRIGRWLLAAVLANLAPALNAEVLVSVDRGSLTVDDTFVLSLKATAGEDLNKTNFGALNQDFDALESRRESNVSIINGRRESTRTLHITLAPKRSGRLVIPALSVDGFRTMPITLMVKDSRDDLNAFDPVFVEAEVDSPRVYVQAQLLLTFRIYRAIALTDMGYSGLEIANASTEQLESANYVRHIDGQDYQVNELRFAIFPQQSGTLEIPALEFTARQATQRRGFFDLGSRGKPLRRKTDPIAVKVLPIPDDYPDAPWLPSSELLISEDWSSPPELMKIGDSTTRTLTLKARGLTGAQLPPIESPVLEGIKIYPDQAKAENISTEEGISALGINSAAWVVTEDGLFEVPEVRIPWWDTDDEQLRYARIPARRLSIAPAPVPETASKPAAASPAGTAGVQTESALDPRPWQWATGAALAGWLLTTVLLFRRRTPGAKGARAPVSQAPPEAALLKALLSACRAGDAHRARGELLRWAAALLPEQENPTISQFQVLVDNPELSAALQALECSLYAADEAPWRGKELADSLQAWRREFIRTQKNREKNPLPQLYG